MSDRPTSEHEDYAALVRGLLSDLEPTSITRLDVRHGDLRVVLRRAPGAAIAGPFVRHAAPADEEAGRPAHWRAVEAPLSGIFYPRPAPDEDTYVQIGGHVEPDSVVGLIETMKMFNEVTADIAGIVREIVVESGELIETGQPLLYVEPGEELPPPVAG